MMVRGLFLMLMMVVSACSSATVTPGMTLLTGLQGYHDEMERLSEQEARWPDRQRLGASIKRTYLLTMGGSSEFSRLVELDLKRREYRITLGTSAARPDRAVEIKKELIRLDEDIDNLLPVVKGQLAHAAVNGAHPEQVVEGMATLGLLYLAIDGFASQVAPRMPPTATVGGYTVIDQKQFAMVRTPQGRTFHCRPFVVPEEGAGIHCIDPGQK